MGSHGCHTWPHMSLDDLTAWESDVKYVRGEKANTSTAYLTFRFDRRRN